MVKKLCYNNNEKIKYEDLLEKLKKLVKNFNHALIVNNISIPELLNEVLEGKIEKYVEMF